MPQVTDTSGQMAKCYNCGEEAQLLVADDIPVCWACERSDPQERKRRHGLKRAPERKSPGRARAAGGSDAWNLWHLDELERRG